MEFKDCHVHSTFSDGRSTPEQIVCSAIEKGISVLGFSDHSYTFFDESYCIARGKTTEYVETIRALKEKYKGQIEILCGIEQDYYADLPAGPFDFSIGSVHYLKFGEDYIPVDNDAETLADAARRYADGDFYALVEEYYRTVGDVARKTGCSLIGHFDLITKFSEQTSLFDTEHPRYRAAWQKAADRLLQTGLPFEINTGAISRGYRTTPYPAAEIRRYLADRGAVFVLSSDSHSAGTLCYGFEKEY